MPWAVLLLAPIVFTQAAFAAQIVATINGVRDSKGTVRLAICPRADFLKPVCPYTGTAPARIGSVVVTIDGVPPGIYAAQAYHDANNSKMLDRSWLGLPEQGIGFSQDAPFNFGPPSFADAAFRLSASGGAITFRMHYY